MGDCYNEPPMSFTQSVASRVKLSWQIANEKVRIDPIQQAIVNENVLAIMGVCMPIVTSLACYATSNNIFDLIGEMLNGGIQIYLGYLICNENVKILIGKSLEKQDIAVFVSLESP